MASLPTCQLRADSDAAEEAGRLGRQEPTSRLEFHSDGFREM